MAMRSLISSDSHVMEPNNFWVERLDNKFRDRAPRIVPRGDGRPGFVFVAPDINPFPIAGGFAGGLGGQDLKEHMAKGYEAARPSGWDPAERLKDQEIDGVEAEVLYTTLGMPLFALDDAELQRACFDVYNDWLAEYCSYNPKRLVGNGLVSLQDVAAGVKQLEHCAKAGLAGVQIWASPPDDRPYTSPDYDILWEAASQHNIALSLHAVTGKSKGAAMMPDPKNRLS